MFISEMPKILTEERPIMGPSNEKFTTPPHRQQPSMTSWKKGQKNSLTPAFLDIDWLTAQPLLPFLVQTAPPSLLYRSFIAHGIEECLEVIEHLRGSQLQKILDFDLWENPSFAQTPDLSKHKVMFWVKTWLQIHPLFAAERFLELEEETIILMISSIFEIIPDGVSYVTDDVKENWWQTIDKKFYLRIRENIGNNGENFEVLKIFVDELYKKNPRFADSVFAYSAMLVRQEVLEDALRWRTARLADQGFVTHDDAMQILAPKTVEDLQKMLKNFQKREKEKKAVQEKYPNKNKFLESSSADPEVFENVFHFLNALDPDQGIRYMQLALGEHTVKQITGSQNISPEYFYDDDDFKYEITEKIIQKCTYILTHTEFQHIKKEGDETLLIEQVLSKINEENMEKSFLLKQKIACLSNVLLASWKCPFDNNMLLEKALLVLRGLLNIGLEACLADPKSFELSFKNFHASEVEKSVQCLDILGLDFLFQLGLSCLVSVQKKLLNTLIEIDVTHEKYAGQLNTRRKISLSDTSTVYVSIKKLFNQQRFTDIFVWLNSLEQKISAENFFVFESFLERIPLFPEILSQKTEGCQLKFFKNTKPFENLNEIRLAENFINNLYHNINIG
jgi:hypothetical protein